MSNSNITAGDELTVQSLASQTIQATVVAGSAAFFGSGSNAAALSGAGVDVTNKVRVPENAFIDGDGLVGIVADSITLTAQDSSSINATAVGTSLTITAAGSNAGALSVGVSLAHNEIDNDLQAFFQNADQTSARTGGDLSISPWQRA